jgi:hypothetical protein
MSCAGTVSEIATSKMGSIKYSPLSQFFHESSCLTGTSSTKPSACQGIMVSKREISPLFELPFSLNLTIVAVTIKAWISLAGGLTVRLSWNTENNVIVNPRFLSTSLISPTYDMTPTSLQHSSDIPPTPLRHSSDKLRHDTTSSDMLRHAPTCYDILRQATTFVRQTPTYPTTKLRQTSNIRRLSKASSRLVSRSLLIVVVVIGGASGHHCHRCNLAGRCPNLGSDGVLPSAFPPPITPRPHCTDRLCS